MAHLHPHTAAKPALAATPNNLSTENLLDSAADRLTLTRILQRCANHDGCLIWQGGRATQGRYGILGHAKKIWLAHRLAFFAYFGELPEGSLRHESDSIEIHHLCHDRLCCNPNHLRAVTRRQHNREHSATRASLKRMKPATAVIQ